MAKQRDPLDDAWVSLANKAEAKYGKGWDYMSPEQKRGAYSVEAMAQVYGFRHMATSPERMIEVLFYFQSRIIDEVIRLEGGDPDS